MAALHAMTQEQISGTFDLVISKSIIICQGLIYPEVTRCIKTAIHLARINQGEDSHTTIYLPCQVLY